MSFTFSAILEGQGVLPDSLSVFLPTSLGPMPIENVIPLSETTWGISFPVETSDIGNVIVTGLDDQERSLFTGAWVPHDLEPIDDTVPRLEGLRLMNDLDGPKVFGAIIVPPGYVFSEALIIVNDDELYTALETAYHEPTDSYTFRHPYTGIGPLIGITVLVRMDDGEEVILPWESGVEPATDLPYGQDILSVRVDEVADGYTLTVRLPHNDANEIDYSSMWISYDGNYERTDTIGTTVDGEVELVFNTQSISFSKFQIDYETSSSASYFEMEFTMDTTETYFDINGDPFVYVRPMPIPEGITRYGSRVEVKAVSYEQHDENHFIMEIEVDDYYNKIDLADMKVYINGSMYPCEYHQDPYYISRHTRAKVLVSEKPRVIDVVAQNNDESKPKLYCTVLNYDDNDVAPYEVMSYISSYDHTNSYVYIYLNGKSVDVSTCVVTKDNDVTLTDANVSLVKDRLYVAYKLNDIDFTTLTVTGQTTDGDPVVFTYALGARTYVDLPSPYGTARGDCSIINITKEGTLLTATALIGTDVTSDLKIGFNGSLPVTPDSQTNPADGPIVLTLTVPDIELATVEVSYTNQDGRSRTGVSRRPYTYGLRYTENGVTVRGLMQDSKQELAGVVEGANLVKDSIKVLTIYELDLPFDITITEIEPGVYAFTRPAYIYTRENDLEGVIVEAELTGGETVKIKYSFDEEFQYPVAADFESLEIRGSSHYTDVRYKIERNATDSYSTPNVILNDNRPAKDGYNSTVCKDEGRFERIIVSRRNRTTKQYEVFTHIRNESTPFKDSKGEELTLTPDRRYGSSQGAFIITGYDETYIDGEEAIQVTVLADDLRDGNLKVYYYGQDGELIRNNPEYVKVADRHYVVTFKHPYDTLTNFSIKYNWYYAEYFKSEDAPPLPKLTDVEVVVDSGQYLFKFILKANAEHVVTQPTINFNAGYIPIAGPVDGVDGALTFEANPLDYIDFEVFTIKYLNDFSEIVTLTHPMNSTERYVDINGDPVVTAEETATFYRKQKWGSEEEGYEAHLYTNETSLDNIEDVSEAMYRWEDETSWTIATNDLTIHNGRVVFIQPLTFRNDADFFIRYNRKDGTRVTTEAYFGAIGGGPTVHDSEGRDYLTYNMDEFAVTPGEGDVESWTFNIEHDATTLTDGQITYSLDGGDPVASTSVDGETATFEGQSKAAREAGSAIVLHYTTPTRNVTINGEMTDGIVNPAPLTNVD